LRALTHLGDFRGVDDRTPFWGQPPIWKQATTPGFAATA
jgi:hypothetical protein